MGASIMGDVDQEWKDNLANDMEEFKAKMAQRPFHRVITKELVDQLPDEEIEVAMYDIIWAAKGDLGELLRTLPIGYALIHFTMVLEGQVSNGGFNQLFHNYPMSFIDLAKNAYIRLGLENIVEIIDEAVRIHKKEFSKKKSLWLLNALKGFMGSYKYSNLDEVNEALWRAESIISEKRIKFIKSNGGEFYGDFRHLY